MGDFEFDGKLYPQSLDVDYGKTLRFDTRNWSVSTFTIGHRNQQGIAVDDFGRIWATEHGPMGGDELNLLQPGGDYGWPSVTLGVGYTEDTNDAKSWPRNPHQGRHEGFAAPVFAWMPSVGVSTVKVIRELNPRINGDLLVASLIGQALFRVRLEDDRVVYAEPIGIGKYVRYADIGNGEIYLLLDTGHFATLRPRPSGQDAVASSESSEHVAYCMECHFSSNAPKLAGIFGHTVATQPGVVYSSALQAVGGVWTEARLRAFLTDPEAFAPGTSMPDPGLSSEAIEAILVDLASR